MLLYKSQKNSVHKKSMLNIYVIFLETFIGIAKNSLNKSLNAFKTAV